ncbi:hypothetical protein BTA35_0207690 [Oceanospirillum linum]|uniref:Alginate export domain-containing protein n=1 Tax=Oceanospirillum linum TaxID=966 RepID=A0A1T1HE09_OCELI|nr:hypothetical protein BTA35_0207690 [Oceanospirillum linum]
MRKPLCNAIFLASLPAYVQAAVISESDRGSIEFNVEAAASVMSAGENYTGTPGDKHWQEAYIKGDLAATRQINIDHSIYGSLGVIALGTFGDGDAGGFTTGDESKAHLENAFVGWRYKDGLLDLSAGRQNFVLGDGFLIAGDALSPGEGFDQFSNGSLDRGGAYYLAGRKSFDNTLILKVDPDGPVRGDLFWLKSDNNFQQRPELTGVNLEYVDGSLGTIGVSYMRVTDLDVGKGLGLYDNRDGMNTFSVRAQGTAGVEELFLNFEYAIESGGDQAKKDATAWTAEAGWMFSGLPWTPIVNYRYAIFSGDKAGTADDESFDPLFFGVTRGFGTWFQGEVAANYAGPFNSGNNVNRLDITLLPQENIALGVQYWKFGKEENNDFEAKELDLYAFWGINDNFSVIPLIGVYEPEGTVNTGLQGNDDKNIYMQAMVMFNY